MTHSDYNHIVLLTGAGVSVASGLPTYRGPGGLWEQDDLAALVDARNLPGSLPGLWRLYSERRRHTLASGPNPAHFAIADFQRARPDAVTLFTQNVDGLHARASGQLLRRGERLSWHGLHVRADSPQTIELHGSAFRTRCTNPRCDLPSFADTRSYDTPPECIICNAGLRPDVVLFGENLPEAALRRANSALAACDLFVAVGTSGTVWPAAAFVGLAAQAGARTVLINLDAGEGAGEFDEVILGRAEEVLPHLLAA